MTDFPAQSKPRPVGRVTRSYASLRSISALMLREMATRYGRSPGGYLWSIVEPLGMILILAVAFAALVRVPPLGDSFIIFFATGYLIIQLYNTVSGAIARAINFSRSLLFYPAVTWIDAVLGRFFLNFLTELLVLFLLLVVLFTITDVTLFLDIRPILVAIAMAATLAFGIGVANTVLFGFFPAWMNIWAIATRPLFLISGIIFLYDDMPPALQTYLWYNPLIHITGLMREGFYPTYAASYVSPIFVFSIAAVLSFFGLLGLGRFHREILNR